MTTSAKVISAKSDAKRRQVERQVEALKVAKQRQRAQRNISEAANRQRTLTIPLPMKKGGKETPLTLVTLQDIRKAINATLTSDGLEELSSPIASHFHLQIAKYAQNKAQELYEVSLQNTLVNRKQNHSSLQDKLNNTLNDIRLYEKGLKMFTSADTQQQLTKYLLKTLGTDFCNEVAVYVSIESNLAVTSAPALLTIEQRNRIAVECDAVYKASLVALNKSLNGSIEDFLVAAENALLPCSMIVKKIDKKRDK